MNMRRAIQFVLLWILFLASIFPMMVHAVNQQSQAWATSVEVKAVLDQMKVLGELNPTLPSPKLKKEPDFTWGLNNTIYWDSDSVQSAILGMGMNLVFFEVQARYDGVTLWGFVDSDADSATFVNLPEKTTIAYYLRYFAQDSNGIFYMSYWSDAEISIQDISPPIIWSVDILGLQESRNVNWAVGPTISIHVVASDPNGQAMELGIREQCATGDYYLYHAFEPPRDSVNISIPYTMRSNEKELSTLTIWVIDVAGQQSEAFTLTLFWWPDEDEADVMCFPNPFNPDIDEVSVIKINFLFEDITEARIFDPFGNLVQILNKGASEQFFEWDGRNMRGNVVANGGYICLVTAPSRFYCKIAVLR